MTNDLSAHPRLPDVAAADPHGVPAEATEAVNSPGGVPPEPRQVAVVREQDAAAGVARANNALQATVDALTAGTGEPLLPAVLRIAAATFGTTHAVYYEHLDDVTARPRHWLRDGQVDTLANFPPEAIESSEQTGALRNGFTVPTEYFGESLRARTRARVIDHYAGTVLPEIDRQAIANGWGMELNVPLVADGRCDGSLVVYRATAYTPDEVALAETLGKQLSLAVRLDRLADARRDAAVAREREMAARDRADRLADANATLKRCADEVARAGPDADAVLGRVLAVLSCHLRTSSAALWLADGGGFVLRLAYLDGEVIPVVPTDPRLAGHWGRGRELALRRHVDEQRPVLYGPEELATLPQTAQTFFDRLGVRSLLGVPLIRGETVVGCLTARFHEERVFDRDELELVQAIAHQGTLAVELTRLAEATRAAAVAREREAAAEERAVELARLNAALREGVAAVAGSADFRQSLAEIVLRITQAAGARVAHLFLYDPAANTLDSKLHIRDGHIFLNRDPSGPAVLQGPFDADITPAFRQLIATQDLFYAADHANVTVATRDGSWPGIIDWHLACGHRSSCAIPVLAGDRPLGIIGLAWREPVTFAPEQRGVLLTLSNHAALVIQLWQLEQAARWAAVAGERNRFAGEIHDTLAQGFAGVLAQLAAADGAMGTDPTAARAHLTRARDLARLNLAEARRSVHALRPLPLAARDLPAALAALGARRGEPPVRVTVTGPPRHLPPAVEGELYRLTQEALANADRHADARRIDVALVFDPDRVVLSVRDDGRGFDPAAVPAGHGLIGMQERMDRAGGSMTIVSEPGRGTEVVAVVPTTNGSAT